jgi:hypothetical protein
LQALAFAEIEMRDRAEIPLEKLTTSREIKSLECVGEQLEIGIF